MGGNHKLNMFLYFSETHYKCFFGLMKTFSLIPIKERNSVQQQFCKQEGYYVKIINSSPIKIFFCKIGGKCPYLVLLLLRLLWFVLLLLLLRLLLLLTLCTPMFPVPVLPLPA